MTQHIGGWISIRNDSRASGPTVRNYALIFALLFVAGLSGAEEQRTWKDATGKFEVQATLVRVADGKAYLRRTDGREIAVPVEKLSQADRDYLTGRPAEDPFRSVPDRS